MPPVTKDVSFKDDDKPIFIDAYMTFLEGQVPKVKTSTSASASASDSASVNTNTSISANASASTENVVDDNKSHSEDDGKSQETTSANTSNTKDKEYTTKASNTTNASTNFVDAYMTFLEGQVPKVKTSTSANASASTKNVIDDNKSHSEDDGKSQETTLANTSTTKDEEYTTKASNTTNASTNFVDDDVKIEDLDEDPDKDDDVENEDEEDIKIEDPKPQVFTPKDFYPPPRESKANARANAKARAEKSKLLRENLDADLEEYFSKVAEEWKEFCSAANHWAYPIERCHKMQYAAKRMKWITAEMITELQTSSTKSYRPLSRFAVIWNLKLIRTKRFHDNQTRRRRMAEVRREQKEKREEWAKFGKKGGPGAGEDPWRDFMFYMSSNSSKSAPSASFRPPNSYPPFNTPPFNTKREEWTKFGKKSGPGADKDPRRDFMFSSFPTSSNFSKSAPSASSASSNSYPPYNTKFARTEKNPNGNTNKPRPEPSTDNTLTTQQASDVKKFLNTFEHQFINKSIRAACVWCLDNFPNLSIFPKGIINAIINALKNPDATDVSMVKKMTIMFHPDKIRVRTTDNFLCTLSLEITKQLNKWRQCRLK